MFEDLINRVSDLYPGKVSRGYFKTLRNTITTQAICKNAW